jgi:DNA-binding CsgD family transcriptional regulator
MYNADMEFSEILKSRSTPGILVFSKDNKLLYTNNEALQIMPDLKINNIPPEVCELCNRARVSGSNYDVFENKEGVSLSMRAFMIGRQRAEKEPSHIMVLLEKIIGKHQTDFKKAQKDFGLTKRETEIMCLICEGYPNKRISDELFIGEYTVKDHIKNIMKKMNVKSRSGIIARLK